jgi:protein disulfide-isomerase A6
LREALGLEAGDVQTVQLIALNARRGWWRRYSGEEFGAVAIESWIDGIRLGESAKEKLPEGIIIGAEPEVKEPAAETAEPVAEEAEAAEHDEL